MASEARLQSAEGTIETLRMENRTLRMKLDSTTNRMTECDESLAQASEQVGLFYLIIIIIIIIISLYWWCLLSCGVVH